MPDRQVFNRYLTRAEEKQLFGHVWQFRADDFARRDYYWMQLLRHTGMRIGNLAALTVGDARSVLYDPEHRLVLQDCASKGGRGYPVKCNSHAREALSGLLKLNQHSRKGGTRDERQPLVLSRQQGRGLSVRAFQQRMRQWVISAGLPVQASPHWFRHTLAKRILETTTHSSPLQVAQHALGHHSLQSTAIYTNPDREDIDRAMELAAQ